MTPRQRTTSGALPRMGWSIRGRGEKERRREGRERKGKGDERGKGRGMREKRREMKAILSRRTWEGW